MRLAAVPIRWHADPADAAARSAESSRTTHPADRPVDACRLLGATVSALITGAPFDAVVAGSFWQWGPLHPQIAAIAAGSWRDQEPPAIKGTGYCVDALQAALWAVAGADDFRGAVLRAANLGDDADTTAAIAGQIAGARWGHAGIPPTWRTTVVAADRIVSLARALFAAGGGVVGDRWPHDQFLHAWWVQPGRLLAGEYPGHRDPVRARRKVDVLVDAGVRTFVDLTTPDDPLDPYQPLVPIVAAARRLDLRHVVLPDPRPRRRRRRRLRHRHRRDRARAPPRRRVRALLGWRRPHRNRHRMRPRRPGSRLRRASSNGSPPSAKAAANSTGPHRRRPCSTT